MFLGMVRGVKPSVGTAQHKVKADLVACHLCLCRVQWNKSQPWSNLSTPLPGGSRPAPVDGWLRLQHDSLQYSADF